MNCPSASRKAVCAASRILIDKDNDIFLEKQESANKINFCRAFLQRCRDAHPNKSLTYNCLTIVS